ARARKDGFAIDNEEYLPGLICVAVLVPAPSGRSNVAVAAQAPIVRLTPDRALRVLPALQRAAESIAGIDADSQGSRSGAEEPIQVTGA
ncbi:MAG: IclR family transcriptional regulator domain-containing protein, partial [Mycobacteriales bacterium]